MYKIVLNNKAIDVVKRPMFIRFLSSGHVAITDKNSANGIVGSDDKTLYCLSSIPGRNEPIVKITKIDEVEYNRLFSLLYSTEAIETERKIALTKAKVNKLTILSEQCKKAITSGFTIKLQDKVQSFKLTTEDQLNLLQIEGRISSGEEYFIYHATNSPCKLYSKADMLKIIKAFKKHTLYHTTYYNVVKQYLNSVTDLNELESFVYGTDISKFAKSTTVSQILLNGDGNV
jgi:hypothetical protein